MHTTSRVTITLLFACGLAPAAQEKAAPVLGRDAEGRATVRAIRLAAPLRLDGPLDEAVYTDDPAVRRFHPDGAERGRAGDRAHRGLGHVRRREHLRRGAVLGLGAAGPVDRRTRCAATRTSCARTTTSASCFDTFYDRRNGFMFYTNPLGALADYVDHRRGQPEHRLEPGLGRRGPAASRAAGPSRWRFRSSRCATGRARRRSGASSCAASIRRKNEWTYLTPRAGVARRVQRHLPRLARRRRSSASTCRRPSRNLEIKPYAISRLTTDRLRDAAGRRTISTATSASTSKYGITAEPDRRLHLNTDFAQVEVDEQQVNLTRFSLFFPEKREFFLEGRGIFDFGRGGSRAAAPAAAAAITPTLFYSRRIGLNRRPRDPDRRRRPADRQGRQVRHRRAEHPDRRRAGRRHTPTTNFTVVRVKRDILRRSSDRRHVHQPVRVATSAPGSNQAYGVDAAFSFFENVNIGGYCARTQHAGPRRRRRRATRARFDYDGRSLRRARRVPRRRRQLQPRGRVRAARRLPAQRSASLRFSPRPRAIERRPQVHLGGQRSSTSRTAPARSRRAAADRPLQHRVREQRSVLDVEATRNYELLPQPFAVVAGVTIPAGGYDFSDVQLRLRARRSSAASPGRSSLQARQVLRRHDHGASATRGARVVGH